MPNINVHYKESIAVIELARPKVNAMNQELIFELTEAVALLGEAPAVRGAILTSQGNVFSAGLDLIELWGFDEDGYGRFWESFNRLIIGLCAFPKPLVAAINGHAPAGGCVMALCCDHRVMAHGEFTIGLNEIPVGIVMPKPVAELASFVLGRAGAYHAILSGTLMQPEEARKFGYVDEICPPNELMLWAETKLGKWLESFDDAWRLSKASMRKQLLESMNLSLNEGYGDTIRTWWSVDGHAAIGRTLERLKRR